MSKLRMTATQHGQFQLHLFDGSGFEGVAIALCGRAESEGRRVHLVHKLIEIPHSECLRGRDFIKWPTRRLRDALTEAARLGLSVMKVHSHPEGFREFSARDDASDVEIFRAVALKVPGPHLSAVMLPDGEMFAREVDADGAFAAVERVAVVGDNLSYWPEPRGCAPQDFDQRHRQMFGDRTTNLLSTLSVGVVGVSGTGSPTVEMLARLGVGRIVEVEPDVVEGKNLNRIWGSKRTDAEAGTNKAQMMKAHLDAVGLGTELVVCQARVDTPEAVALLSTCDIVFGCVDSVEGRDILNRIATFYSLPYFDLGVRLDADGAGGVASVSAGVHYLQPGGSSLKSRGVYSDDVLHAEYLKRTDPNFYEDQVRRGYVRGVRVDSPAVISINTLTAATAVNEFLARLHPYRTEPNGKFAVQKLLLTHGRIATRPDGEPDLELARNVGRGDCAPLLMSSRLEDAA